MLLLLEDAKRRPELFDWFGAIPRREIEDWLLRHQLELPPDIIELWHVTGGGDVFESETILRPTVASYPNGSFVEDDIESFNTDHATELNRCGVYVFQRGVFLSAVRLRDQYFVTLTKNYVIAEWFSSLDEWYANTLRAEFGPRYGLSPNDE